MREEESGSKLCVLVCKCLLLCSLVGLGRDVVTGRRGISLVTGAKFRSSESENFQNKLRLDD